MTKPKLFATALLLLASVPIACAIRYKNDPAPPPRDPSPIPPFGASTWHELPALYSGDPANPAAGSAHQPTKGTAAASARPAPSAAPPRSGSPVASSPVPTVPAVPAPPPPPQATASASAIAPSATTEPTCEQFVAKMGRIMQRGGAGPLAPEASKQMLAECERAKAKAPKEWRACTECMLGLDEAKPDPSKCQPLCEAMEDEAREG